MQHRIIGVLVIAVGVYSLWVGLSAVVNARQATDVFVDLGSMFGQSIDRTDFLLHWRVAYAVFAIGSALGVVAGVAMLFLKRWSCLLLMGIATAALVTSI